MRKVVLYELLSLDGVAEEPGNWMFDVDPAVFDNLERVIERQDAVLLGRGTYDYWAGFWPTSDVQPFANFINRTPKHVVTSSQPAQEWENSMVVREPVVEHVVTLKQQEGGDIGVHGSISLVQTLLRSGLVDELRLVIAPTLAHRGRRLFEDRGVVRTMELLSCDRSAAGNLLLAYRLRGSR